MSRAPDDREGLSPSPPNILDLFEGDDEEDDEIYEAAEDQTTEGETNDEDEEGDYLGP